MRNKFDGIIFDVDGTLTSTNQLIFDSFNHIAKKYLYKTLSDQDIIALFGPTEDYIIEKWFPDNAEEVKKDYYDFYSDNHNMAELYPGSRELLDLIKSANVKLGVFTGKGKTAAMITLEKLGIVQYFDMIITGSDVVKHKPSSEGIIKFLEAYNLSKEKVLMIGDAPADIQASREAGVQIASVVWDSYAKEEVLESNGALVFHTVEELKNFIAERI